jgi:Tfp pilus assembly protein PilE
MRNLIKKCESGLTLVEMLTAVSIIVIMGGSAYAVFNTAIKAYHRTQSKLIQSQRCRVAMNQLVTDLRQMQADTSDEMFVLYSEDVPTESIDRNRDILSFVTLVKTDPDPFVTQANAANILSTPPLSDVRRVAYYVGPKVTIAELRTGNVIPPPYIASQEPGQNISEQEENLALYRIVTTALNPELVIQSFMNTGTIPTVDEDGTPILSFEVNILVDGIINFDVKYIDEESGTVYDSWDQPDIIPIGIQALISVIDEERRESTSMQNFAQNPGAMTQGALTQSTMVYLPASANNSSN